MANVGTVALTCMAVQICTTSVYSYLTDCYKSQAGECSQILNFARQTQAFPVGFYAIEFGDAAGFWASGLSESLHYSSRNGADLRGSLRSNHFTRVLPRLVHHLQGRKY